MKEETKLGDALTMRSSGRDVNTGLLSMFVDCHVLDEYGKTQGTLQ
jgi:hypothetical protein